MENQRNNTPFDVIVVGSGPAGATLARELTKRNKSVLVLERGGDAPLKEGSNAFVLNKVWASEGVTAVRALTTGGTTAVYFAVAEYPELEPFRALGMDLSAELEETKRDLPMAVLPDSMLGAQSLRLRDSAQSLGYDWKKSPMLVDVTKCPTGYKYEAKWNARSYLSEAVAQGATLVTRARVLRVLLDGKRAIGVEYEVRKSKKEVEVLQAFGEKIVLAAGGAASPLILRDSGLENIVSGGFYCHPSVALFGSIRGLKAGDTFIGTMGTVLDGNIGLGDGNPARMFYRMFMLANKQWLRSFFHSRSIGVGVMVKEGLGGGLQANGRYHKELKREDLAKLEHGEAEGRRILTHAGAKNIIRTPLTAAHIGGAIQIKKDVDQDLQTAYQNLHVCDGSVIPESVKATPTLTLVCLGKYLANRLAPMTS